MAQTRITLARVALAVVSAAGAVVALSLLLDRPGSKVIDFERQTSERRSPRKTRKAREVDDAPSVLEVSRPDYPPSTFVRKPWQQRLFAGTRKGSLPDPFVHYRYPPDMNRRHPWPEHPKGEWWNRTNSMGLREDDELLPGWPDLRVLVAGDSHTDGVCNNDESFANLLEASLRTGHPDRAIEAVNAGRGGYDFYHYLGTLERYVDLRPDVFVVAVYGGNDFESVLTLYHEYNGSERPPGSELYLDLIDAAVEHAAFEPALAQSFLSLKYFDVHPDQMEVALQAARDISTEILVACLRHSAHPIFVYIPPMSDVEWSVHAETFDSLAELLQISPEGLRSTQRMADSYLDYLRSLRVDVIDMRDVFRAAGPGNYWLSDHHINLRGHELLAEALEPVVLAGHPPERNHTRRAPGSTGPLDPKHLLSAASGLEAIGAIEGLEPFERVDFDLPMFEALYADRPNVVFDPFAGFSYQPSATIRAHNLGLSTRFWFETNSASLRADSELERQPEARVVLTGDEQASGACANDETIAGRTQALLQGVEVVNAAVTGYGFQNYYGILERTLLLRPKVFVMAVSSGTDFFDSARVEAYLAGRPFPRNLAEYREELEDARSRHPGPLSQSFDSIKYFEEHRPAGKRAVELALKTSISMQAICQAAEIEFLLVHMPGPSDTEGPHRTPAYEGVASLLQIPPNYLDINSRLAEAYLEQAEAAGIRVLRLEPMLGAADESLFFERDAVLNPSANALIAERLAEEIERLLATEY